MFSGYKTYICAAALAIISVLHATGVIDSAMSGTLSTLFGAGGLAALRAAVK